MKARCVEGPEGQRGARGQGLGRRAGRRQSVSSREPPGAWSWEARRAASAPNAPGGCGPCLRVLWTFSPDPAPVLCHPARFWGWGVPCVPLSASQGGEGTAALPGPGRWAGGPGLSKPRVSSAGSTGRQPVRTDSHALRGLATVLPAARTDACHRRGRPDVTIHHRIPLLPPGAWEAGKLPGFTQKGSRSARKKKIKTGALPPPRLTMRT